MNYSIPLNGIAIQLGLLCPLECSHCYVGAGPKEKEKLTPDAIEKIITGFGGGNYGSKVLALTGGEPFSLREELKYSLDLADKFLLDTYVNTSAYFGRSVSFAKKVLKEFSSIKRLEISIDKEHQKFVPMHFAINTAIAAHEVGMDVQIAVQQGEWEESRELREAVSQLHFATVYQQTFSPVGSRNKEKVKIYQVPSVLNGGCGKIGNLLFDERGYAYPCCGSVIMAERQEDGEPLPGFTLGSIYEDSFENIVNRLFNEDRLKVLAQIGPTTISKVINSNLIACSDETFCHTCLRIHKDGSLKENEEKLIKYVDLARSM